MSLSQQERLVEHFQNGKTITSLRAYTELGITQLATRISEIEAKGHKIAREWITVQNRFNEDVRVVQYSLEKELAAV